jgi:TIR domain
MNDVFISYAREDENFVRQLADALQAQERQPWLDWEALPISPERLLRIERAIEGTQTFVFVISPYSVHSTHCLDELNYAVQHHKRLVPLVFRSVSKTLVPEALQHLPSLTFRKQALDQLIDELILTIDTDLTYVREHTQLQKSAIEWDEKGRNPDYLLPEASLQRSREWLIEAEQDRKEPRPSDLQRRYVLASQGLPADQITIAIAPVNEKDVEPPQRSPQMLWIGSGALATTLIGSSVAAVWSWNTMTDTNTEPEKTEEAKKPSAPSVAKATAAPAKPIAKKTEPKTAPKPVAKPKAERVETVEQSRPSLPREVEVEPQPKVKPKPVLGLKQRRQLAIAALQKRQAQLGVLKQVDPKIKLAQQQQQVERALLATHQVWKQQQTPAIVKKRQTPHIPEHENLSQEKKPGDF